MEHYLNMPDLGFAELIAILPMILFSICGLLSLLTTALKSESVHKLNFVLFVLSAIVSLFFIYEHGNTEVSVMDGVLYFDQLSFNLSSLSIISALAVITLAFFNPKTFSIRSEFYALISFAIVGMIGLASSKDLSFLFICLELVTFSTFVLIAMERNGKETAEASLKYFVMSAVMSGVFLMGMSFLFGSTGTFHLAEMKKIIVSSAVFDSQLLSFGILFVLIGLLFKVGAFPFHSWLPDVYSGSDNLISTYMVTAVKASSFAVIGRFFFEIYTPEIFGAGTKLYYFLYGVVALSLLFGAFVGTVQSDFKRTLAYSSISHTGFILAALFSTENQTSTFAVTTFYWYIVFYVVAALGAFVFLQVIENSKNNYAMTKLDGLFYNSPFASVVLAIMLMSLAGIPPTAGFFGKYYVVVSLIQSEKLLLSLIAIFASLVAAYFYLKPIVNMFLAKDSCDLENKIVVTYSVSTLLTLSTLVVLVAGFAFFL